MAGGRFSLVPPAAAPTSGLDFTYPDLIVDFAECNQQLVIGAPGLVWDEGFGSGWTTNDLSGMDGTTVSRVLFSNLRAMVRRYRGRVAAWIVRLDTAFAVGPPDADALPL